MPVHSVDFYPTLLEVAGRGGAIGAEIDGVSLLPLLKESGTLARDALYWHYPHYNAHTPLLPLKPSGAVRRGDQKLIERYEDGALELYNLRDDIGETTNLAARMPERAGELRSLLAGWRDRVGAQMPEPDPENDDPRALREWIDRRRGIRH